MEGSEKGTRRTAQGTREGVHGARHKADGYCTFSLIFPCTLDRVPCAENTLFCGGFPIFHYSTIPVFHFLMGVNYGHRNQR